MFEEHLQHTAEQLARDLGRSVIIDDAGLPRLRVQAQQAATQLHIHRTTLYWRLARAAGLIPLDLRRGDDRLKLHLALTLADLTHPPAGPPS